MSKKFMKKNADGDIVQFTDSHTAYVQLKGSVEFNSRWFPKRKPPMVHSGVHNAISKLN